MILMGCCIIPCIRGLIQRLIETALTKQTPASYHNNLFIMEAPKDENEVMLAEFEERTV